MLSDRVAKARKIAEFGLINHINKNAWLVPGTNGKKYLVTRRARSLRFRCDLDLGGHGLRDCKGNAHNGTLCYHCLAAIIALSQENGKQVAFCNNEKDAERLSHLGGSLYKVSSGQGRGQVWIVVK